MFSSKYPRGETRSRKPEQSKYLGWDYLQLKLGGLGSQVKARNPYQELPKLDRKTISSQRGLS